MISRRVSLSLAVGLALAVLALFLFSAGPARAEEPEVLKGTVKSLGKGVLYLTDVSFSDPTLPRKDIRIALDNATDYYYGATKVSKESLTPDCRVLLKCTLRGQERRAVMVRIIGGKAP